MSLAYRLIIGLIVIALGCAAAFFVFAVWASSSTDAIKDRQYAGCLRGNITKHQQLVVLDYLHDEAQINAATRNDEKARAFYIGRLDNLSRAIDLVQGAIIDCNIYK